MHYDTKRTRGGTAKAKAAANAKAELPRAPAPENKGITAASKISSTTAASKDAFVPNIIDKEDDYMPKEIISSSEEGEVEITTLQYAMAAPGKFAHFFFGKKFQVHRMGGTGARTITMPSFAVTNHHSIVTSSAP